MPISETIKKCVLSIGLKGNVHYGPSIQGTGFCVALWDDRVNRHFFFVVTAQQCIEALKRRSADTVYLRVNSKETGVRFLATSISDWQFHPAEKQTVDVAVYPIHDTTMFRGMDIRFYTLRHNLIADKENFASYRIGPGREVFIGGLFFHDAGRARDIAVIRTGKIAGIPEGPVYLDWCHPYGMEAYLIEANFVGGMGGCPVFVKTRQYSESGQNRKRNQYYRFLGLMHGSWNGAHPYGSTQPDEDQDWGELNQANAGIAVVVPAGKILEVLQHSLLVEMRSNLVAEKSRDITAAHAEARDSKRVKT